MRLVHDDIQVKEMAGIPFIGIAAISLFRFWDSSQKSAVFLLLVPIRRIFKLPENNLRKLVSRIMLFIR